MKMICPHCGLKGTAGEALFGKKVRCPECQQVFRVNEDVAMVSPPAPEASDAGEEIIDNSQTETQEVEEPEQTLELPGDDIGDGEMVLEDEDETVVEEIDAEELTDVIEDLEVQEQAEEEVVEVVLADGVKACSKCGFALSETFLQEIDGNMVCGLCVA